MTSLLSTLRSIVGDAHVLTEGDLTAWEQDWRRRVRGKALAVVRPASTPEVAAVVKACAAAGTAIVPQGGNTGLAVGSTPDASGTQIVLSLTRMNAVRNVDTDNLTMTVEAGCILAEPAGSGAQCGRTVPLSLAAEGSCTIGGNLGTNARRHQVVRYGKTRDLCLGLEVVTPKARCGSGLRACARTTRATTCATCSIGSEGTLGIITAACMKLYPSPPPSSPPGPLCLPWNTPWQLLGMAHQQLGAGLTGFEVMGQFALSLVGKHMPQLRVPLPGPGRCALVRAARKFRQRI